MLKLDGGREVIAARFLHPVDALTEFQKGKISFMPPQFYILSTLADILQGSVNTREQRASVEALSGGLFGRMVINPLRLREDEDGRTILTYEGDESRGGPNGRLHRAFIKIGKAGVCPLLSSDQDCQLILLLRPQMRCHWLEISTYFQK